MTNSAGKSEAVILCEGFHDRAFWAGWLLHLGCADLSLREGGKRVAPRDPWGTVLHSGQYGYQSLAGQFVRVLPCTGKENVVPAARVRLRLRGTKPVSHVVINVDSDTVPGTPDESRTITIQQIGDMIREVVGEVVQPQPNGVIVLDSGATKIHLVRWEVAAPASSPGLPDKNTLERLVSASISEAYPGRGACVQEWLSRRPDPPAVDPKEHALSYLAGWYAASGCDFFYSGLWLDEKVRDRLKHHLTASGAWQVVEAIVG